MPLNSIEDEWLADFFGRVEECEDLSEWETSFIGDQHARYKQYGADTRMSPKQWGILLRVATEKLGLEPPEGRDPE